jgi:penicillin-insensitive murein DD-endopeptidase
VDLGGATLALSAWVAVLVATSVGCTGLFAHAGQDSLSLGTHSQGALIGAVALPEQGDGYLIHPDWCKRGRNFAIEELVNGLTRAFAKVQETSPGSVAYVGDLSVRRGGNSSLHRSHESGRDVDIFFYATGVDGKPLVGLPAMLRFAADGRVAGWSPGGSGRRIREPLPDARFDQRRTWLLVRALLSDPEIEVQWIFMHKPLVDLCLQEAEREGTDPALLARAREILRQPSDSQAHDDHMHVRVFCPAHNRMFGCLDKGPRRWWKKRWKYMGSESLIATK